MSKSSSTNYPKAYHFLNFYFLIYLTIWKKADSLDEKLLCKVHARLAKPTNRNSNLDKNMEPIGRVFTSSHLEQRS